MMVEQPKRQWFGLAVITLLFFAIGFLGVMLARTASGVTGQDADVATLVEMIHDLEEENNSLAAEIAALMGESASYETNDYGEEQITALLEDNGKAKEHAGLTELQGSGIVITLDDDVAGANAAQQQNPNQYNAEDYIVHDLNLLYLINDLRPYAKGIAINGQRIVISSTIRCVGTVILVNQTRLAPPYRLEMIGDSEQLLTILENSATYQDLLDSYITVQTDTVTDLSLPAFTGYISEKYITATPTEPTENRED